MLVDSILINLKEKVINFKFDNNLRDLFDYYFK